ncbi:LLM class flavin-dependent oxidoreductase [Nocardia sp. alder85J]|uniref:LLM class flavin-dependent oxidoreductase n=1 Tax=Nocardia sp. alder85J TaxID=2862949 RepID=UPI001CD6849F|nr:LLM class flavin-dependent oxidoreductase [Nocardia sp. alder85J]MCX4090869.1 LLM class flavin-dependent oxidoreductase [Nocardia sp. alder85J]
MTHIVLPRAADAPEPVRLPVHLTDLRPAPESSALALARAADLAGLAGVLVPFDPDGPESLVTAAALLRATRYVEIVAGIHSGIATPQYAAKLSASLQRFSGGRLGWHLAADDPGRAEFVAVAREFWHSPQGLPKPLSDNPFPALYLGGVDGRGTAGFVEVDHDPGEVYRLGEKESARVG